MCALSQVGVRAGGRQVLCETLRVWHQGLIAYSLHATVIAVVACARWIR